MDDYFCGGTPIKASGTPIPSPGRQNKIELRQEGDHQFISGYAAVFFRDGEPDTEYWITDNIVERIMPGAFDKVLEQDTLGVYNHNDDYLLGRNSNDTMDLIVDNVGLRYDIRFDANDPDHLTVKSKIDRGDLSGSSFAFWDPETLWRDNVDYRDKTGVSIRSILDVRNLYDVGPVGFPAYKGTSAGLRCGVHTKADADLLVEIRKSFTQVPHSDEAP